MIALRRCARGAIAASLVSSLLFASSAHAQAPSDSAMAEQLFIDGQKLMAQNKTAEACPKLAESQRLDPKLGTLLNLATCHEQDGKLALAWSEFMDAISLAERAKRADRVDFAKQHALALEKKLARVKIATPPDATAANLELRLDGKQLALAALGSALPLDPGHHTIEASGHGKKTWTGSFEAPMGGESTVTVPALEDAPIAPPSAPSPVVAPVAATPETSSSSLRTAGYVVGGVGLAGIAVGSIFGVLALVKESRAEEACPNAGCPTPEGIDRHDDARTSALISTIGFIAGAALTAGGVVLVLSSPKGSSSAAAKLRVHFGGASIGGSF